ncbi:MAG TPA: alanine dehydrogenase [Thiotrichales bacterium]|nr:alanine dehydrogenase [Thiotrichales bacterium]
MRIGIPREVKVLEGRVGLVPDACAELVSAGHEVWLERGAGEASGYPDPSYSTVGVKIAPDAAALYEQAQLVVKVKEPQPGELPLLRRDHLLFCYLHLAAAPELARSLQEIGLTAIAFETVEEGGRLPLLAPMSEVAGRISVQAGTRLLHRPAGGKGVLLGGVAAAPRGHVVVLGGGVAGGAAASVAAAMGAEVTVFDRQREKLERMRALGANVTGLFPYREAIAAAVRRADLVVGAVLIKGARAPHLVSAELVREMQRGSVVIDISVDQGGCIETTRPTTWAEPTFEWEGVLHFGVTNMPGAVPRTSSQALSAALFPYLTAVADGRWQQDPRLLAGVNIRDGEITHPAVREALAA